MGMTPENKLEATAMNFEEEERQTRGRKTSQTLERYRSMQIRNRKTAIVVIRYIHNFLLKYNTSKKLLRIMHEPIT